jgi:hypothetical protein
VSESDDVAGTLVCDLWASTEQVLASGLDLSEIPEDTGILDDALAIASDILFTLSGRRWRGTSCTRTVKLEPRPYRPPLSVGWNHRRLVEIARLEVLFGHSFGRPHPLFLPDWPVTAITSVVDNGPVTGTTPNVDVTVDPATYDLVNARRVDHLDTGGHRIAWPWQHAFTITYVYGQNPPPGGVRSAIALGAQIALAAVGSKKCRLPQRTSQVNRQGVAITILDPMEFITKGQTGLPEIDLWIASVNPNGGRRRPAVWSPDVDIYDLAYPEGPSS